MQSSEKTVAAYLKSLPPERAVVISEIRALVNKNIKPGFVETMRWGMISWEIPLDKYPNTYNKQPSNSVYPWLEFVYKNWNQQEIVSYASSYL